MQHADVTDIEDVRLPIGILVFIDEFGDEEADNEADKEGNNLDRNRYDDILCYAFCLVHRIYLSFIFGSIYGGYLLTFKWNYFEKFLYTV